MPALLRVVENRNSRTALMNTLKLIGLTLFHFGKQICLLPQTIVNAFKQRKLQAGVAAREVERLDRIRNPDKYRGKEL